MINKIDTVIYLKALSDETRLKIVEMLAKENLCACHILESFDFTQPTLSYHMKILVDSGLVDSHKDGTWTRYTLNQDIMQNMSTLFLSLTGINTTNREVKSC